MPCKFNQSCLFNLAGEDSARTALEHDLQLAATHYLPTDKGGIPTGEWRDVSETFFDFRRKKRIGYDFLQDDDQKAVGGYDHAMILAPELTDGEQTVASLFSPEGDVRMDIATTLPAMQVYTGNYLISVPGKSRHYTPFQVWPLKLSFHRMPLTTLNGGAIQRYFTAKSNISPENELSLYFLRVTPPHAAFFILLY